MKPINLHNDIVPFGKYKGQPLEVMQNDAEYCDWLMAQDWFRDRHAPIYQLIVNNFGESSETPEHNKLQTKFLDDKICLNLLAKLSYSQAMRDLKYVEPEILKTFIESKNKMDLMRVSRKEFEYNGWDVKFNAYVDGDENQYIGFLIEIKPSLGDDYPAILRQMKANSRQNYNYYHKFLVFDKFTAIGATQEEVIKIFNSSGFFVVKLSDILIS